MPSLSAGDLIGPYQVLAPLGAGGMGEVYLAKDTKLEREVAIKVLPAALASDVEQLARFRREAQMLAALNQCQTSPPFTGWWNRRVSLA
jgi:eukaryotic-like serine/threonine-protein kinase